MPGFVSENCVLKCLHGLLGAYVKMNEYMRDTAETDVQVK